MNLKFWNRQSYVLESPLKTNGIDISMFKRIIGYEDYKILFAKAVTSQYKLNIMCVGAKGTGKSEFLKEIERKYKDKVIYIDGASTTTKAGLRDILFKKGSSTKFLLVDEINLLDAKDLAIFLSLAQDNRITVTMNKTYKTLQLYNLKIFGTCNFLPDNKKISAAINDRFDIWKFKPYEYDQLLEIALYCLRDRIKNKELITYIVNRVYYDLHSSSMRDIMDISAYNIKNAAEVDHYIATKMG